MLVSIRKPRPPSASLPEAADAPARAQDILLACHGKIRSYASLAERLAAVPAAPLAQIAEAAQSLHRYHHVALPLHEADEDRSVRAALVAACAPAAVLDALGALEDEHRRIDALVAELLPAWSAIALEPSLLPAQAPAIAAPTRALAGIWALHLGREEAEILPAVGTLPEELEQKLRSEMRARRASGLDGGVASGPLPGTIR